MTCACDSREALQQLVEGDFVLMLMDIQMPVMNGLEALQQTRSGAGGIRNPKVPVVALTAYAMESDRVKFLHAGMDDYQAKSIEWRALDECLRQQLP